MRPSRQTLEQQLGARPNTLSMSTLLSLLNASGAKSKPAEPHDPIDPDVSQPPSPEQAG